MSLQLFAVHKCISSELELIAAMSEDQKKDIFFIGETLVSLAHGGDLSQFSYSAESCGKEKLLTFFTEKMFRAALQTNHINIVIISKIYMNVSFLTYIPLAV